MSEDGGAEREKTMEELMAELESGEDGFDAFDKMLDEAARLANACPSASQA